MPRRKFIRDFAARATAEHLLRFTPAFRLVVGSLPVRTGPGAPWRRDS